MWSRLPSQTHHRRPEMDWQQLMHVDDWTPAKRSGLRGPRWLKDEMGWRVSLFSYHPSWSITWLRYLEIVPQKRTHFRRFFFRVSRTGMPAQRSMTFAFLWLWSIRYSWQPPLAYPPAPKCTICGDRIDESSHTWCGRARKGCAMPEPGDKRAVYARWQAEREET